MKPEKCTFIFIDLLNILGFFLFLLLFFSSFFYSSTYNYYVAILLVIILVLFLVSTIIGTSFLMATAISNRILKGRNLPYFISQQAGISEEANHKRAKISQIQRLVIIIILILGIDFLAYFSTFAIYMSALRVFSFLLILLGLYILLPTSLKVRLFHKSESSKS